MDDPPGGCSRLSEENMHKSFFSKSLQMEGGGRSVSKLKKKSHLILVRHHPLSHCMVPLWPLAEEGSSLSLGAGACRFLRLLSLE